MGGEFQAKRINTSSKADCIIIVVMNEIIYQSPPQQHGGNNKVQHPRGRIRRRRRPLRTRNIGSLSFLILVFSTNYSSYSTEAFNANIVLSSTPRLQQNHILYATSNKNNERRRGGGNSSSGKKKQRHQQHSSLSSSKLGKLIIIIIVVPRWLFFFNGLVLEY